MKTGLSVRTCSSLWNKDVQVETVLTALGFCLQKCHLQAPISILCGLQDSWKQQIEADLLLSHDIHQNLSVANETQTCFLMMLKIYFRPPTQHKKAQEVCKFATLQNS